MADDIFADLSGLPKKASSSPGPAFSDDAVLPTQHSSDALGKQGSTPLAGVPMVGDSGGQGSPQRGADQGTALSPRRLL